MTELPTLDFESLRPAILSDDGLCADIPDQLSESEALIRVDGVVDEAVQEDVMAVQKFIKSPKRYNRTLPALVQSMRENPTGDLDWHLEAIVAARKEAFAKRAQELGATAYQAGTCIVVRKYADGSFDADPESFGTSMFVLNRRYRDYAAPLAGLEPVFTSNEKSVRAKVGTIIQDADGRKGTLLFHPEWLRMNKGLFIPRPIDPVSKKIVLRYPLSEEDFEGFAQSELDNNPKETFDVAGMTEEEVARALSAACLLHEYIRHINDNPEPRPDLRQTIALLKSRIKPEIDPYKDVIARRPEDTTWVE